MNSYLSNPNLILIAIAIVPAIFLMIDVYKLDRLDKEPTKLLISLAVLGVISTVLAEITETLGIYVIDEFLTQNARIYNIILYFVVVGISEELFKYLLLKIKTWKNPNFNCQFDGVVYAVFVSLGFALWENLGYTFQYGIETALVRAVTAIPGHTCFGVFMGIFYGAAKRMYNCGEFSKSRSLRILAVTVPVLLHGTYDYCADSISSNVTAFALFTIIMFVISYILIRKVAKNDRYI